MAAADPRGWLLAQRLARVEAVVRSAQAAFVLAASLVRPPAAGRPGSSLRRLARAEEVVRSVPAAFVLAMSLVPPLPVRPDDAVDQAAGARLVAASEVALAKSAVRLALLGFETERE